MTQKERAVMQQALKAMEDASPYGLTFKEAITALREALEQHKPHEECECSACLNYFTDKAHEEALEHVTDGSPCWCNPEMTYKDPINGAEVWVHKELQMSNEEIIKAVKNSLNIYSFTAEALEMLIDNVKKKATVRTKDPCNPLQDLTDDEIYECYTSDTHENTPRSFARAVITKYKEKNK